MLTHPTIDQLRALKLDGMADAFINLQAQDRAKDLDHAEWLALLLDREAATRNTKRFQSRLRSAKLRHGQASIEDVDYRTSRRLDKALFQELAAGRWIVEHRNLLVTGPCGVGKSWLSCALAQKACRDGYTVHYARVPRLFADLELAHGDGRFARLFRALEIGARSYTSVTSILKSNLDRKRPAPTTDGPAITHANIRGPRYFH